MGLDSKRTIGVRLFVRDSMRRGRAGIYKENNRRRERNPTSSSVVSIVETRTHPTEIARGPSTESQPRHAIFFLFLFLHETSLRSPVTAENVFMKNQLQGPVMYTQSLSYDTVVVARVRVIIW